MAKKSTELKLSDIKKTAKSMHEMEPYELEDGKTITFYPLFPELMIEQMLEEIQKHYITLHENEIEFSEKMNLYFINLMMIKYFTHFKKDMPDNLFAEGKKAGLLDWLNHFADTGLLKTIMDEVFMKDQVMKVHDKIAEFIGASQLLEELGVKAQKKFEDLKLKNADVFEQLNKMNVQ
jgi:hypothetical protein